MIPEAGQGLIKQADTVSTWHAHKRTPLFHKAWTQNNTTVVHKAWTPTASSHRDNERGVVGGEGGGMGGLKGNKI